MKPVMTLLAVILGAAVSYGEEPTQVPKQMLKELQYLVGTWEVEGRVGDEKTEGTWSAKWAPGKHCLMRQSSHVDGGRMVTGIGVIGWDAATERITEQVFFGHNECALIRWKVMPSGNWEGEVTGFQDGKKVESKVKFTKRGPGEILYEEKSADGKEAEVLLRKAPQKKEKPAESGVPEAAVQELKYRVGKWESIGYVDGKKEEQPGFETTEWIPGQYAIRIGASWVENRVQMHGSSLVGWDADKKQLVEHWYASDGGYATFRYDLGKQKNAWVGTFAWVYGDGRKFEGKSVVQKKSKDEWEWNASCVAGKEKHTWRTINRRVK